MNFLNKKYYTLLISSLLFFLKNIDAQVITIKIQDSISKEVLPGCLVTDSIQGINTTTNNKGLVSFKTNGKIAITCSFIGYKSKKNYANILQDSTIYILLSQDFKTIENVTIVGNKTGDELQMSSSKMTAKSIQSIPTMLGESDIVKSIATTAGVKQVEGTQGFNVRGSSQDQNMVLYDDAVIYNSSHLLGMYSVFNTKSIRNVNFYKSGIPARYGGRLASVLAVESESGNSKKWERTLSIGLLASNISVSGPIIKDTLTIAIAVRRTYIDKLIIPIVNKFISSSISKFETGYFFADGNFKIQYKPNWRNTLEISAYGGNDKFHLSNNENELQNLLQWGNRAASFRWRFLVNPTLSVTQLLTYSYYQLQFDISQHLYKMNLKTGIENIKYRNEWLKTFDKSNIRFGAEIVQTTFNPSDIIANVNEIGLDFGKKTLLHATEPSLYAETNIPLGKRWKLHGGVRWSSFIHIGPFTEYKETVSGRIDDSVMYEWGKPVMMYNSPEPRIQAEYEINSTMFLTSSISYNKQYIHLIPIVASALPIEMWLPSTHGLKPQSSLQMSMGGYIKHNGLLFSIDAYAKQLYKVSESANTMITFYNKGNMEQLVIQGDGVAYGLECMAEKKVGTFKYQAGYTYSRSLRNFEMLNDGNTFPAKYDKPHDVTITVSKLFGTRWTISSLFTYSSGVNITMPIARYFIQNNIINVYGAKNGYRMPSYHRADIAIAYTLTKKPNFNSDITLSVSNIYNRLNPYYMYYSVEGSLKEYKLSVTQHKVFLFPIMPSLTYNCTF